MSFSRPLMPRIPSLTLGLLTVMTAGCAGDDTADESDDSSGAANDTTGPDGNPIPGPAYALRIDLFNPEGRTAYVYLSNTIDVTPTLDNAFEIPGVGNFAAVGGRVLISSGDAPVITEYEVAADLTWQQTDRSVSFAAYPLDDNANFFYQFIQNDHTAILPFDGAKRIVWDPTSMGILRTEEVSSVPLTRDGLDLVIGGNRAGAHFRDGDPMHAYWYVDPDWVDFGSASYVAVYDAASLIEKAVLEIPCPGLSISTRTEDGSTYFSAFDMTALSMQGAAVEPCIAKVTPTRTLEATWDLREWTGGWFATNFRYIGGGKAVANVFRHDVLGVSEVQELDPTALTDALWAAGPYWEIWLLDVETRSGRPIEGIVPPLDIDGWSEFSVVDGRTFVFLGYEGGTRAYELDPITGIARQHFDISGGASGWIRVR